MAASGLNSEIDVEETDLKTRWAHLADLTHFALELKETLDNINKESFNNFVLKIGVYPFFVVFKDVWKNETTFSNGRPAVCVYSCRIFT